MKLWPRSYHRRRYDRLMADLEAVRFELGDSLGPIIGPMNLYDLMLMAKYGQGWRENLTHGPITASLVRDAGPGRQPCGTPRSEAACAVTDKADRGCTLYAFAPLGDADGLLGSGCVAYGAVTDEAHLLFHILAELIEARTAKLIER